MGTDFENELLEQLQAEIIEDARKVYPEKLIERWFNPRNMGKIEDPQGFGRSTGLCGDIMEISLRVKNSRIIEGQIFNRGLWAYAGCGKHGH
jgi:nitrogen fixation NifU-like protein